MKLTNLSKSTNKKAISPIISVVLLVLVAAILTGAILSWAKESARDKLDIADEHISVASDLTCIKSDLYIAECTIDYFTKDLYLLIHNNSNLKFSNVVLTIEGNDFDGDSIKAVGDYTNVINKGSSIFISTASNFIFRNSVSLSNLDPYTINNISLTTGTCVNKPIIFSDCDVVYG